MEGEEIGNMSPVPALCLHVLLNIGLNGIISVNNIM